jgi:hypothetical protein
MILTACQESHPPPGPFTSEQEPQRHNLLSSARDDPELARLDMSAFERLVESEVSPGAGARHPVRQKLGHAGSGPISRTQVVLVVRGH